MKKTFKFEKDPDGRWYIVLPEWDGERDELEMVGGADTMLDILAQGESPIFLELSTEEFDGADKLDLLAKCSDDYFELQGQGYPSSGAFYQVSRLKQVEYDLPIWLCDVTKFVFGDFPKTIYIK